MTDLYDFFFLRCMVGTSAHEKFEQNTNGVVPLDTLPEHHTERCSQRFRPGNRFCEIGVRYLSPDREGDKFRPLDHK